MFMNNHCSEMRNANSDVVATKPAKARTRYCDEGTLNQDNCEFVKLNW